MMNYAATEAFSNTISFQHNVRCRINGELVKPVRQGFVNRPVDVISSQPEGTSVTIDVCFTGTHRVLGTVVMTKLKNGNVKIDSYSERFADLIPESEKSEADMLAA